MTRTTSRAGGARRERSRLSRAGFLALVVAVTAGLALLASACGNSSGEGVAQVETTDATRTGSNTQNGASEPKPTAYAACMRKNGAPNFPDPDANGEIQITEGQGLDPNLPSFKRAEKACQRFMPRGGPDPEELATQLQEALGYSACMRKNGVPNYPDPKASERGIEWGELSTSAGVDPDSPQLKTAEEACKELAPGADGGDAAPRPGSTPRG
jgi:hypothetical protein